MASDPEAAMSEAKRLWTRIAGVVEALEGLDDPLGDYALSLGKRVEKLERELDQLKQQRHARPDGAIPDLPADGIREAPADGN